MGDKKENQGVETAWSVRSGNSSFQLHAQISYKIGTKEDKHITILVSKIRRAQKIALYDNVSMHN